MKQSTCKRLILMTIVLSVTPISTYAQQDLLSDMVDRARSAGIEQSQIDQLQRNAERSGISNADLMTMINPAVSMAEKNLPWEMVFIKASEGMSKGVSPQQMEPVLSSIAENSKHAAELVDPWMNRPEVGRILNRPGVGMNQNYFRNEIVKAGTKTLSGNFDRSVFEQTLNTIAQDGELDNIQPSAVLAAINVLSDLPTAAKEPTATAQIVLRALQSGFDAGEMQKFGEAMNASHRKNQLPASAIADGLNQQLMGGAPAAQILHKLFNDNVGGGFPGNVPPGLNSGRATGGR